MKVLIIDDSIERVNKIKNKLQQNLALSVEIDIASTSSEGLKYLQNKQFDFLILDVVLPRRLGEAARYEEGVFVLNQLTTKAKFLKPTKIIGITAESAQLELFKDKFYFTGFLLIDQENQPNWLDIIHSQVKYANSQLISHEVDGNKKLIITIHGIRTFGEWQSNLNTLIELETSNAVFKQYKYGYEALLAFILPFLRQRHVSHFYKKLKELSKDDTNLNIYIFAHSFGTYITANALNLAAKEKYPINIKRIIFSGSMLDSNFNWLPIQKHFDCSIVNECGNKDKVLLWSEALVPDAGMAGRIGFKNNFEYEKFINRHHNFGHSGYFIDKNFMKTYWVPLVSSQKAPIQVINKNQSRIANEVINPFILFVGVVKNFIFKLFYLLFKPLFLIISKFFQK